MNLKYIQYAFSYKHFLVLLLLMAGVLVFASTKYVSGADSRTAHSASERLVTFHDRGETKVVLTDATTVESALEKADITLEETDIVEPELDHELVASDYSINIYRSRPVVVVDGLLRQRVMTPYQNPVDIAEDAGIEINDEDELTLGRTEDILTEGAGLRLDIERATPFTLVLYGKSSQMHTKATTVSAMLKEKDIKLDEKDTLSVKESDKIRAGMKIEIWRNGKQTVTEEVEVPFPIEQIQDADREVGFKEIREPGTPGSRDVTYEIVMRNGKEVSRREIQSVVTKQPKKQIEVVGAKPNFDGDFAAALAQLRACEGGYDSWNPAGPYYGAYQFDRQTWGTVADPSAYGNATPAQQDQAARNLYMRRGWQPWPHCGANLPDTFR